MSDLSIRISVELENIESCLPLLPDVSQLSEMISKPTFEDLKTYLAFRYYFTHAYALDIEPQRMEPLVANLAAVYQTFKRDLSAGDGMG